jgi:hypothetical protein
MQVLQAIPANSFQGIYVDMSMKKLFPKNHAWVADIEAHWSKMVWLTNLRWTNRKMKAKDFNLSLLKMEDQHFFDVNPGCAIALGSSKPALKIDDVIPPKKN